jgi:hypothetical protein
VQAAEAAVKITEMGSAARVIGLIQPATPGTAGKAYDLAAKGKEKTEKVLSIGKSTGEVNSPQPDGMEALSKLDASKPAIQGLMADAKKMVAIWGGTLDFLITEKYARIELLNNKKPLPPATMLSQAQSRLPALPMFSSDELDSLETEYLWQLISTYCKQNARLWSYRVQNGTFVVGLNDTQITTILKLFGYETLRRAYFWRPNLFYIESYMRAWGVEWEKDPYEKMGRERGPGRV